MVAVLVAGDAAFDFAGAVAGSAGGEQRGQDGSADGAEQVGWAVGTDAAGGGEFLAGGFAGGVLRVTDLDDGCVIDGAAGWA